MWLSSLPCSLKIQTFVFFLSVKPTGRFASQRSLSSFASDAHLIYTTNKSSTEMLSLHCSSLLVHSAWELRCGYFAMWLGNTDYSLTLDHQNTVELRTSDPWSSAVSSRCTISTLNVNGSLEPEEWCSGPAGHGRSSGELALWGVVESLCVSILCISIAPRTLTKHKQSWRSL